MKRRHLGREIQVVDVSATHSVKSKAAGRAWGGSERSKQAVTEQPESFDGCGYAVEVKRIANLR